MGSLYWHETTEQRKNFTSKLLKWWFSKHGGVNAASPDDADAIAVSACSTREIPLLASARRVADSHGKPLIVGGFEAYTGSILLAWADYVCVGEGFRLLESAAKANDVVDAVDQASNVIRPGNAEDEISPDYWVPWAETPPIQTAKRAFYYLAGRGCHMKCRFCMTSWVQPHASASDTLCRRASRSVMAADKQSRVVFVTNDAGIGRDASSTTLRMFLDNDRDDWPMVVRLGIEGVTEERRRWFAKPISDADVAGAIRKAKEIRRQLELFFIVGFDDDPSPVDAADAILHHLHAEPCRAPRVYIKFTWFEPSPHTPLGGYDVSRLTEWDYDKMLMKLRGRSGRFRLFRSGKIGRSAWSALMRRMPADAASDWLEYLPRACDSSVVDVCSAARAIGGGDIVSSDKHAPWRRVKTRRAPVNGRE